MFRETYPKVRAYALRRTSPDVAHDVVAETFLVAWRRFDEVPEDALPWLYGVARKTLANQRRSSDRGAALAQRLAGAESLADPPHVTDGIDDAEIVRLAMARLSDIQREALMLVAWHGLTGSRAARAAGCSSATFAVRLYRAKARLAAELAALESLADAPPMEVAP